MDNTVVNNGGEPKSSSAGWMVALVVIVLLALAAFVWPGFLMNEAVDDADQDAASIEVNVPTGGVDEE